MFLINESGSEKTGGFDFVVLKCFMYDLNSSLGILEGFDSFCSSSSLVFTSVYLYVNERKKKILALV